MSKERDFIDTLLLFFKPEEPYTNTKERIDDLARLCEEVDDIEIKGFLLGVGETSLLRMKRLGNAIQYCAEFIVRNQKEISNAYERDRLDPWISEYSKKHMNDDVVYLYSHIVNENGEDVFPEDFEPTDEYLEALETSYEASIVDAESVDDVAEDYSTEFLLELRENLEDLGIDPSEGKPWLEEHVAENVEGQIWGRPLTKEELLALDFIYEIPVKNPFQEDRAKPIIREKIALIDRRAELIQRIISNYVSSDCHKIKGSVAEYAEAIAPLIDGKVFNEPVDGEILERVLSLRGRRNGLSIRDGEELSWVRVIWLLHRDGPPEFRKKDWLYSIGEVWGLTKSDFERKPFHKPGDRVRKFTRALCEVVKEISGAEELYDLHVDESWYEE